MQVLRRRPTPRPREPRGRLSQSQSVSEPDSDLDSWAGPRAARRRHGVRSGQQPYWAGWRRQAARAIRLARSPWHRDPASGPGATVWQGPGRWRCPQAGRGPRPAGGGSPGRPAGGPRPPTQSRDSIGPAEHQWSSAVTLLGPGPISVELES